MRMRGHPPAGPAGLGIVRRHRPPMPRAWTIPRSSECNERPLPGQYEQVSGRYGVALSRAAASCPATLALLTMRAVLAGTDRPSVIAAIRASSQGVNAGPTTPAA